MTGEPSLPRAGKYRDLLVWQKSMTLVTAIYNESNTWPRTEQFGLVSQTQRAGVSIPANIAEGNGRNGRKEYVHHLGIARGSLHELETLLEIAHNIGYVQREPLEVLSDQCSEIGRVLSGMIRSLSDQQ